MSGNNVNAKPVIRQPLDGQQPEKEVELALPAEKTQAAEANLMQRRVFSIGLGGQGKEANLARKQALQNNGIWGLWAVLLKVLVKFLVIDSDPGKQDRFDIGEFRSWDRVKIGRFIKMAIANSWLFPGLARFGDLQRLYDKLGPLKVITRGCGGNREVGGALQEWQAEMNFDVLENDLTAPLRALSNVRARANGSANGRAIDPDYREVIIGSGGSTASASCLPLAWLQRDLAENQIGIDLISEATVFQPSVLNVANQEQLQAHDWAFWLEQELIYRKGEQLPPMKIGKHHVPRTPVFRLYKLVNGVDELENTYSPEDVYAIEAECWRMSRWGVASEFLEGVISNVLDNQQWPYVGYSQNCLIIKFPKQELQTLFAYRTAEQICAYLVRQVDLDLEATPDLLKVDQVWLKRQQITWRELPKRVAVYEKQELKVSLLPYRGLKWAVLHQRLKRYTADHIPFWKKALARLGDQHAGTLEQDHIQAQASLANRYGLPMARYFWEGNGTDELKGVGYWLTELIEKLKKTDAHEKRDLERFKLKLKRPPWWRSFMAGWMRLVPGYRERQLRVQTQTTLELQLSISKLQALEDILAREQQGGEITTQALSQGIDVLPQVAEDFMDAEAQYAQNRKLRPVYEENVFQSSDEEEEIWKRDNQAVLATAKNNLVVKWLDGQWGIELGDEENALVISFEELAKQDGQQKLLHYVETLWQPYLDKYSVEEVLARQGKDPHKMVEEWKNRSRPLVQVDLEEHRRQQPDPNNPIELERHLIIVTRHGTQEGFFQGYVATDKNYQILASGASTTDRIEVIQSQFNISPLSCKSAGAHQAAYERKRAAGEKLHIFDEAELGMEPVSDLQEPSDIEEGD